MDKPVDIFMDYHQICIYIRAALLYREFVVAMDFIKFQFPSCNRTLSILRRIKGSTVVCILNTPIEHGVAHKSMQNIRVNPQIAMDFPATLYGVLIDCFPLILGISRLAISNRENCRRSHVAHLLALGIMRPKFSMHIDNLSFGAF